MKRWRSRGLRSTVLLSLCLVMSASAQVDDAVKLTQQAKELQARGDYEAGIAAAKRALEIRQQTLGEHPDTAASLLTLAILYRISGALEQAESLYQQSLAMSEKLSGPDSPEFAAALNGLAIVQLTNGALAKAEPLYLRVLAIREKVFGEEHPETANILNNLGVFYKNTGEFAKSEALLQRALAVRQKLFGPVNSSAPMCLT